MPIGQPQPLIDIGPWKGIDNFTAGYYIDPKRCTDCLNLVPDQKIGSYVTVLGRVANTGALPNACLGFTRFDRLGTTSVFIGASDATLGVTAGLWQWTKSVAPTQLTYPTNVTPTPSSPSLFAASGTTSTNWLFMVNGVDPMVKIDQNLVVTLAQLAAPTTAPTVALGGAGNLNAQGNPYSWRVTFGSATIESGAGTISASLSPANQQVNLTAVPVSTDPQCTQRNIYRIGGTWSIWLLVGTINDNTTTTFTDNVADAALGQALVIVRDQPPVGAWYIASHKDRLFTFGTPTDPAASYYSNSKEPFGWDRTNQFFTIGKSSVADQAQGLASLGSILIYFKSFTTWVLFGDDPTSFIFRKLMDVGCIAPRSITAALGIVFWLGMDGAWMYDGSRPTRISTNIQSTILGLSTTDLQRCAGAYRNGVWYLSFPAQGVTYCFNIATQEWYKIGWAGETMYFDASIEEVDASRTGVGNIDTWFAASTDLGLSISSAFTGKIDDSQLPESKKCYRYIELVAPIQSGQTAVVTLIFDPGINQTSMSRTVDLSTYPIRKQISIPPPQKAYQAEVSVTVSSTVQVEIQRLVVIGWPDSELTVPQ
jgi:hypothetical protein